MEQTTAGQDYYHCNQFSKKKLLPVTCTKCGRILKGNMSRVNRLCSACDPNSFTFKDGKKVRRG